jgi:sensor histidine kinase YesM
MITQPFIENAIEHGIKHKSSKGSIHVHFSKKDGMILIEIEDDGVGRAKAMEILSAEGQDRKPLSISIIRERIKVLNRSLKKKITLEIRDLKDERGEPAGTKVMLELPLLGY